MLILPDWGGRKSWIKICALILCSFSSSILLLKPVKTCQWNPFWFPGFFSLSEYIVAYSGHFVNTVWALDSDHLGCDPGSASDKLGDHAQVLHAFRAPVSLGNKMERLQCAHSESRVLNHKVLCVWSKMVPLLHVTWKKIKYTVFFFMFVLNYCPQIFLFFFDEWRRAPLHTKETRLSFWLLAAALAWAWVSDST